MGECEINAFKINGDDVIWLPQSMLSLWPCLGYLLFSRPSDFDINIRSFLFS